VVFEDSLLPDIRRIAHACLRLERDYKHRAVEVALSTAAAPTYFPTLLTTVGIPLIDGGVWANNPVAIAMVGALGILHWNAAEVQILSLGCTTPPVAVSWAEITRWGSWGGRARS
jgi:hypothetical protein